MNGCSDIRIFIVTHKPSPLFDSDVFSHIQVGSAEDIPGIDFRDNTDDNIARKNRNYCELTAQYWIWKNVKADYVGLCHYRRIPSFTKCAECAFADFSRGTVEKFGWTKQRIGALLKTHNVLLPPLWTVFPPGEPGHVMTPYEFHAHEHRQSDISEALRVIQELTPDIFDYAKNALCVETKQCFANVCVMRKDLFDNYSEWLFKILFELEKRITLPEDPEQARVFGYLSERLIMAWLAYAVKNLDARPWFAKALPLGTFPDHGRFETIKAIRREPCGNPILSVIVPVFNVEKYISKCLNSICAQCEKRIEIICIDDGSTDGSSAILQKFGAIDGRIRIIRQENRGLGAARNRGIEVACGKYLAFVDSDDWIDRLAWYRSIRKAERHDLDLLIFDEQPVDDNTGLPVSNPWYTTSFPEICYRSAFTWRDIGRSPFDTCCHAHNKIVLRSFWGSRRFPEGVLYEDAALHFDLLLSARRIGAYASGYYYYRLRRGSIMNKRGEAVLDHLKIITPVWMRLGKLGLREELAGPFAAHVQNLLLHCRKICPTKECHDQIRLWFHEEPQAEWRTWNICRMQRFRFWLLERDSPFCDLFFNMQNILTNAILFKRRAAAMISSVCKL